MEVLGLLIRDLVVYFYANSGLIVSTQPEGLQGAFDILAGLFERVILKTNIHKTTCMACHTCHAPGRMSLEAYDKRIMGTGPFFGGQQRRKVD